ncbi:MAG: aldo/keto reductase [Crocosphaera sp.]|jgi:aryl-alcohol dehydrogenase-like predicted oxidoreductase
MTSLTTRRNFLLAGMTMVGTAACHQVNHSQTVEEIISSPIQPLPERKLGNTGISLPILGLGGAGQTPLSKYGQEASAIAIIEAALKLGIRYFDTASSYGPSEDYLGKVLPSNRSQVFLATKTDKRDYDGAWRELEKSLQRLQTDYIDFWQLHHVSFEEDLERIFEKNGAAKAIEEAKAQKIIRFSGITGHHEPQVIANALQRYPFDMILVALNAADIHHPRPFSKTVLPVAQEKNVGVIAMKVPAYGRLLKPGALSTMEQAMGYVLSLRGVHSCIIAAETVQQLAGNVKVAAAFQPLNPSEMSNIETLTATVWEENTFFRRWT